jgi:hypothetical protein
MTDPRPAVLLCLRDDDVCFHAPVHLLARLRAEVWQSRPVTAAVIPQMGGVSCSTRTLFGAEAAHERDFRRNVDLVNHLQREVAAGCCEVAIHGVTHLDHAGPDRLLAEFEIAVDSLIERLLRESVRLRDELGTSYFVPPHNAAHPAVVDACHGAGLDVCRSLTSEEVLRVAGTDHRDEAKSLQPYRWRGERLEAFQTILLSKERILRNGLAAADLAGRVVAIAARAGMAVITVHWWDFATGTEGSWDSWYSRWMRLFLDAVESQLATAGRAPVYATLSGLTAALRSQRGGSHIGFDDSASHACQREIRGG